MEIERRTKHIQLLLSPTELAALRRLAAQEGMPLSVTLRMLLRVEAYKRGVWPAREEVARCEQQ